MIRSWIRGPEATTIARLLTGERENLVAWDLEYVSISGGPTQSRVVLHRRAGVPLTVTLDHTTAAPVIAYVSERAPQVEKRPG